MELRVNVNDNEIDLIINFGLCCFSEIVGKKVYTEDNSSYWLFGRFDIFGRRNLNCHQICYQDQANQKLIISIDYLQKINKILTIEKEFLVSYLRKTNLSG